MIELRDKADSVSESGEATISGPSNTRNDAIAALVNLGYNQKVAERIVRSITDRTPDISIEDLIKDSLAGLNN